MKINDPDVIAAVKEAVLTYETALMTNDLATMKALFKQAPETVRYGVGEMLYGDQEIAEFRKTRKGGSPQRKLTRLEIASYGDNHATSNAQYIREDSPVPYRQSQTWVKFSEGWRAVSAHVSFMKAASKLSALNALSSEDFIYLLGGIYEHSPWVAEEVKSCGPFESLAALVSEMKACVDRASSSQKLDLLKAHPELAGKAAIDKELTKASTDEQASAGLDRLSPQEIDQFNVLNAAYNEKFDFSFIICVRETTKLGILDAMKTRLKNSVSEEFSTALDEVHKIAGLRLESLML